MFMLRAKPWMMDLRNLGIVLRKPLIHGLFAQSRDCLFNGGVLSYRIKGACMDPTGRAAVKMVAPYLCIEA